ncbi:MAG TPA: hypothetical protein VHA35_16850 [Dongiaceae bacterium]|nr:hypothetical protein [Dongiaceae bacterium]
MIDAGTRLTLRPPEQVMRLARLGAFHQTRLSFLRAMLRAARREGWRFARPVWRIDARGVGVAVYAVETPEHTYSLVCFGHDLPDALRSDRVIAEAWDATFVLYDGVPGEAEIARLLANAPKQEAGRYQPTDLVLSRANRSVRLFEHVVAALAAGRQPDRRKVEEVGYLMRTTAVYGNGKFGMADRDRIAGRDGFVNSFRAEMLTVWLIRTFTLDLVEHLARLRSPGAVAIEPKLRRRFGVGNSTGLGMAPFLVRHPALLDRWIAAREEALAIVRALPASTPETHRRFKDVLARARLSLGEWRTVDAIQNAHIAELLADLGRLAAEAAQPGALERPLPWDALMRWGEAHLTLEGQEYLVTLLLEPHGAEVDFLADRMWADEAGSFRIDGSMRCDALAAEIARDYRWAIDLDFADARAQARFWYVSEEKLEPRLGERASEPGGELEHPLAIGRDVAALYRDLKEAAPETTVAAFLLAHPEHRHAVRRVQVVARHPYAEIRDNLIDAALRPIDLLRCKLAFFGATRFDPRSDRWLRISLFPGAPFPEELAGQPEDDWIYAAFAEAAPC